MNIKQPLQSNKKGCQIKLTAFFIGNLFSKALGNNRQLNQHPARLNFVPLRLSARCKLCFADLYVP